MKLIFTAALALSLLSGTAAIAQPNFQGRGDQSRGDQGRGDQGRSDQGRGDQGRGDQGRGDQGRGGPDRYDEFRNNPGVRMSSPRFSRGDRVPEQYRRDHRYAVDDWQSRHLRRPPRGYHWVRDDNDNYFLAAVTTGLILDLMLNSR